MKILLTGGSGLLGTELRKIDPNIVAPDHAELDITDFSHVYDAIMGYTPDMVIHAAALTDNRIVERRPHRAIGINITGTSFLSMLCVFRNIRIVYISTDYIYKGDRGNYREDDEILPVNFYAWTKLGGECAVNGVKNHLIIRTSFGPDNFAYHQAFVDKWSNKDYVSVIAPMIYEAAISPITGVLNIGTERKTLFDYASKKNTVKPIMLHQSAFNSPYDTSMNLQKWLDYKSNRSPAKPHTRCRCCGNQNLVKYLDLGNMPLANNLEFTAERARNQERFPLQVMFCPDCGLSQLSVVVDRSKMFSYYTYRSSINQGYIDHCRQMARDLKHGMELTEKSRMIDIAGNDGTLLKEFRDEIGLSVLNVDPATNLTAIAEARGIPSITDFWSEELASKVEKVDLITATNVFAHVDDQLGFLRACKSALLPDGEIVLEFPYLSNLVALNQFDTIYFEHMNYMLVTPLDRMCKSVGLKIISITDQNIHGGSVRVRIVHTDKLAVGVYGEYGASAYIEKEVIDKLMSVGTYKDWALNVDRMIKDFTDRLIKLKKEGHQIAAFAASAKGNTLLNAAMIGTDICNYIVDQTPEKIGKFSPGTGIPIVGIDRLMKEPPEYLLVLSWNFKEEIIEKCRKIYGGKYIIPIPEFTIVD